MMKASDRVSRGLAATVAVAMIAGGIAAVSVRHTGTSRAYAEEARVQMVQSYREASSWRAHVEERERQADGTYRATRHRIAVGGPDRYRVETIEHDEGGRQVVSVTLRSGTSVYSLVRTGSDQARLLEIRNVPPDLGVRADNLLGQRVSELARARSMRYVGRESVRGRSARKLALDAGHHVWLDEDSSLPVREEFHSGDTLIHDIEVLFFEADATIDPAEFEPGALGGVPATVEDFGFRPADPNRPPSDALGFEPRRIEPPSEWHLVTSGYTDPAVRADGAGGQPVWLALFDTSHGQFLVSQWRAHHDLDLSTEGADGTLGPLVTEVAGRTVAYYADEWTTHATSRVGDVFVSVESAAGREEVLAALEWVR